MAETDPTQTTPQAPIQAGTVIAPGTASVAAPAPSQPAPVAVAPNPPQPQAAEQTPAPVANIDEFSQYGDQDDDLRFEEHEPITWTASEFIAHQKSGGWYGLLALATTIVVVIIFAITRDFIASTVVIVGGIALGVYGARQPRQLQYQIDDTGVTVGQKHYDYDAFRYFSIVPEGAFSSIIFTPLKRFAQLTTIYYAPQDEEKIIELLSLILPLEEYKHDPVDRFMHAIRF